MTLPSYLTLEHEEMLENEEYLKRSEERLARYNAFYNKDLVSKLYQQSSNYLNNSKIGKMP